MLKRQIALWMVIGLFFSCSNDDGIDQQTMDMRINHYQNTGMAVGPVLTTTSGYRLLDQIEIDCNMLCNGLDLIMQHEDFVVGTFKRLAHNEIQLIALK